MPTLPDRVHLYLGSALLLTVFLVGTLTILSFFYAPAQWDVVNKVIDNADRWVMFLLGVISGATVPSGGGGTSQRGGG